VIGEYGYGWLRLSPHVYTRVSELDKVAVAVGAAL